MQEKEVFLKEDIVWAFDTFLGQLKSSEAIYPQTIRVVEHLKKQIVEIVPTHEVGSNWHTGTPTEEGWYLLYIHGVFGGKDHYVYEADHYGKDYYGSMVWANKDDEWRDWEVVAYQKITPYEGEEVNGSDN